MTVVAPVCVHEWQQFGGGRGCMFCSAWSFNVPRTMHIDALPTGLLQQPQRSDYGASVAEPDLAIEVMSDLLELVAQGEPSWFEYESMAVRIIERVRASS